MKRKTPIKHIVKSHQRKNKTVHSFVRGKGQRLTNLANPILYSSIQTVVEFNQAVKSGMIPIEKVNFYRFWYGDVFQDFPGRTLVEAKTIRDNYEHKGFTNTTRVELTEFSIQQYRAYLETKDAKEFDTAYIAAKKKRGITKSTGEFWLFKGKEYNNVGIPKNVYLKARAKTERELGIR